MKAVCIDIAQEKPVNEDVLQKKIGGLYVYCVVVSKIKDIYTLRHIIYDIDNHESLNDIKAKYYADYCKTPTDEFHLCTAMPEVMKIIDTLKAN